jgi:hypothetical protein
MLLDQTIIEIHSQLLDSSEQFSWLSKRKRLTFVSMINEWFNNGFLRLLLSLIQDDQLYVCTVCIGLTNKFEQWTTCYRYVAHACLGPILYGLLYCSPEQASYYAFEV